MIFLTYDVVDFHPFSHSIQWLLSSTIRTCLVLFGALFLTFCSILLINIVPNLLVLQPLAVGRAANYGVVMGGPEIEDVEMGEPEIEDVEMGEPEMEEPDEKMAVDV